MGAIRGYCSVRSGLQSTSVPAATAIVAAAVSNAGNGVERVDDTGARAAPRPRKKRTARLKFLHGKLVLLLAVGEAILLAGGGVGVADADKIALKMRRRGTNGESARTCVRRWRSDVEAADGGMGTAEYKHKNYGIDVGLRSDDATFANFESLFNRVSTTIFC